MSKSGRRRRTWDKVTLPWNVLPTDFLHTFSWFAVMSWLLWLLLSDALGFEEMSNILQTVSLRKSIWRLRRTPSAASYVCNYRFECLQHLFMMKSEQIGRAIGHWAHAATAAHLTMLLILSSNAASYI